MRWCRDENQLDASGRHRRPSQRPLLCRGARTNLPPSVPTLGPALSHRFSSGTFSLSPGTRNVVPNSLWGVRCSRRFSRKLGRLASLPPVSQGRQSAGDTRGHRRGGRRLPRARRGPWMGRPRPEPEAGLTAGGGGASPAGPTRRAWAQGAEPGLQTEATTGTGPTTVLSTRGHGLGGSTSRARRAALVTGPRGFFSAEQAFASVTTHEGASGCGCAEPRTRHGRAAIRKKIRRGCGPRWA